jgi:hypothetical protein
MKQLKYAGRDFAAFMLSAALVAGVYAVQGTVLNDKEFIISETMPGDFNFSVDFGIYGRNNIDTYDNKFTKDLVTDGTETIDFIIPEDKMREIYDAFIEYKIYELPEDINAKVPRAFIGDIRMHVHPADAYAVTYTCNGITGTVRSDGGGPWEAEGPPDTHKRLADFIKIISDYIYSTEEYENMPPAGGGYA